MTPVQLNVGFLVMSLRSRQKKIEYNLWVEKSVWKSQRKANRNVHNVQVVQVISKYDFLLWRPQTYKICISCAANVLVQPGVSVLYYS